MYVNRVLICILSETVVSSCIEENVSVPIDLCVQGIENLRRSNTIMREVFKHHNFQDDIINDCGITCSSCSTLSTILVLTHILMYYLYWFKTPMVHFTILTYWTFFKAEIWQNWHERGHFEDNKIYCWFILNTSLGASYVNLFTYYIGWFQKHMCSLLTWNILDYMRWNEIS